MATSLQAEVERLQGAAVSLASGAAEATASSALAELGAALEAERALRKEAQAAGVWCRTYRLHPELILSPLLFWTFSYEMKVVWSSRIATLSCFGVKPVVHYLPKPGCTR
jgi:hypothetical protein